jgi:hypothetical protein
MLFRNITAVYYVNDGTLIIARYKHNGEILNDRLGSAQCRRKTGKAGKFTDDRPSSKLPGARLYCRHLCISPLYHYMPTVHINPFTPTPSHSLLESQSFRFSAKILSRSVLPGETKLYFLFPPPGPERPLGTPARTQSSQEVIECLIREEICILPTHEIWSHKNT